MISAQEVKEIAAQKLIDDLNAWDYEYISEIASSIKEAAEKGKFSISSRYEPSEDVEFILTLHGFTVSKGLKHTYWISWK